MPYRRQGKRIVEAVTIQMDLDPFLSMNGLAAYSSLSRRTLQNLLTDPLDPLPSYRVGAKIVVRKSEFDAWMSRRRNRKATAAAELAAADAAALLVATAQREASNSL
jgi:hypothetical protein